MSKRSIYIIGIEAVVLALSVAPASLHAQTQIGFTISTVAGNGTSGFSGDGSAATSAQLGGPFSIAVDGSGAIYIADQFNNRIRKVSGGTISTVAGSGTNGYAGDGAAATKASLSHPSGVAVDSSGNFYIADTSNYTVRKVVSGGNISTIAGVQTTPGYGGDGAAANKAQLSQVAGIALDAAGNLFIADANNQVIRKVGTDGKIVTVAGSNFAGYNGDGGPATSARLNNPVAVAVDRSGNLYIADANNHRIRMVAADSGVITTVAGTGSPAFSGEGGPAAKASLNNPRGVAVDAGGNVYISDTLNNRIRVVGTNGIITTVAGNGSPGNSGDGGPATMAQLFFPAGLFFGANGNLYLADNQNSVIRLLSPVSGLPSVSPNGISLAASFGGGATIAPGSWIEIYGSNLAGNARSWTADDFQGNNAPTALDGTSVTIGGQPAFVDYISPGQVDAQVPSTVVTGTQQLTVSTAVGASISTSVNVVAVQPALYAPKSFQVGGTQYVGAVFVDGSGFVMPPNAVPGIPSHRAKAGDAVTLFGIGFGQVNPNVPAGQIVTQSNMLAMQFGISLGGTPAGVSYAGLAPGAVGLYQFNIVVPDGIASSDSVPVTYTLGGVGGSQTLYTAVGN